MTLFAFSFAAWTCRGCRQVCEWVDAVPILDERGNAIAFRHADCTWEDE